MTTTPSKPDLVALAPCPFCGGPAHSTKEIASANLAALVMCTENDCATVSGPTLADAAKRWNTRHLASQPFSYEAGRYVLVPVEPTDAMLEAGEDTFVSGYTGTPTSSPGEVWKAMVAATLPVDGGEVEEITSSQMDAIEQAAIAGKPLSELSSTAGSVREALEHLGKVLYFTSAIHPDDRNNAVEDAAAYYNAQCPYVQVDMAEHATWRTVGPLSAPVEAPVAVKPLEWRDHRPDSFPEPAWSAQTPFGFYNIEEVSASDSPGYVVRLHAHHFIADKDSLDEAKAAAQSDYEQRIRSALIATAIRSGKPDGKE